MRWSHAVFRDGPVPQLILDGSGRIEVANPAALALVGRRTVSGVELRDLVGEPDRPAIDAFVLELSVLGSGLHRSVGPVTIDRHGESQLVEVLGSRAHDPDGPTMLTVSMRQLERAEDRMADPLTGLPGRVRGLAMLDATVGPDAPGCLVVIDVDCLEDLNASYGMTVGDAILVEVAARLRTVVPSDAFLSRIDGDAFLVVAPAVGLEQVDGLAADVLAALTPPMEVASALIDVTASVGAGGLTASSSDAALTAGLRAVSAALDRGGAQLVVDSPKRPVRGRRRADLLAALQDATQRTEVAHREARTDALTGVHNRRRLDEDVVELQGRARSTGQAVAALYLDLDEFGTINKVRGHVLGDRVLTAVATILQAQVRAEDGVYRRGGEEFVILLADADRDEAQHVAERVRTTIESARILHGGTPDRPVVTATVGVAAGRGPEIELRRVILAAEEAMRRAKQQGRNRVVVAGQDGSANPES